MPGKAFMPSIHQLIYNEFEEFFLVPEELFRWVSAENALWKEYSETGASWQEIHERCWEMCEEGWFSDWKRSERERGSSYLVECCKIHVQSQTGHWLSLIVTIRIAVCGLVWFSEESMNHVMDHQG